MKILHKFETYFIVLSFATMTLAVFLQVVNRFIFKIPVMWPEELARYLMIWMSFVAGAVGFRKGAHMGVDILVNKFTGKSKQVLIMIQSMLIILFTVVVAYFAMVVINMQLTTGQLSPALQINLAYIYLAILVWTILTLVEVIALIFKKNQLF